MKGNGYILFNCLLLWAVTLGGQPSNQVMFMPNKGQWAGSFDYKLQLSNGSIFHQKNGYRAVFTKSLHSHRASLHHSDSPHSHTEITGVAYQMRWLHSSPEAHFIEKEPTSYPVNYIKGKNRQHWLQNYHPPQKLVHKNIYPGVSAQYYGKGQNLKYDLHLAPGVDPEVLAMRYKGLKNIFIKNGVLHLETAMGSITESIPLAYQWINNEKKIVTCYYVLRDSVVHFAVKDYDPRKALIIDPVLIFSTFSGSGDNNFGFTATYGKNGTAYGAGVNFGSNYPTTLGVFQRNFQGNKKSDIDVSISKFSADGSKLLYATYLGGTGLETPHSIVEDADGNLIILGNTGSADFPTTQDAYIDTFMGGPKATNPIFLEFENGSDIFIAKLDSSGSNLLGSTFWGGSSTDGFNLDIFYNYGDQSRGEVIITPSGEIAIVGSSCSDDISMPATGSTKTDTTQDAVVGIFSPDLRNLKWARYIGGSQAEAGYSIKAFKNKLFIAGATSSPDFEGSNPDLYSGGIDAFLTQFNLRNGSIISSSYFGTAQRDQGFLVTTDRLGYPYLFGQTKGAWNSSSGVYSNSNSQQFLMKLDTNGKDLMWQTTIGSGQNKNDLVPTAFMVDRCFNIYISGWNGNSNRISNFGNSLGNTRGLPVSSDALKSNTDGSDFYLMVLNKDAKKLLYATYIGGGDDEHVDGGTSRFSPDGQIYQAVCTNCQGQGFPTTPGVYSPNSGSNRCNMNIFKMDFEKIVHADASIQSMGKVDSLCNGLRVIFNNASANANHYQWIFGNGQTSNDPNPTAIFDSLGIYEVLFIASDTICGLNDTLTLRVEHKEEIRPKANFTAQFNSCDARRTAYFNNQSGGASQYLWKFDDGSISNQANPRHQYNQSGTYQVKLIAIDTICQKTDTIVKLVSFQDTISPPQVLLSSSDCSNGELVIEKQNDEPRYQYTWTFKGKTFTQDNPKLTVTEPGTYLIPVTVSDTLCNRTYFDTARVRVNTISLETFIPNAFSPNGDNLNEEFVLQGNRCAGEDYLRIFNRWGEMIFETNSPYEEFWDGSGKAGPAPQGVYTYVIQMGAATKHGFLTLMR